MLKCGKKRVWIDPNETNEVALANSRKSLVRFLPMFWLLEHFPASTTERLPLGGDLDGDICSAFFSICLIAKINYNL